jgi:thiol-disulfide isomerase/thioredoxin
LFTPLALLLGTIKPTAGLFAKDHYSIRTKQISTMAISRCCGKTVSLEQYKELVFINFWATWCPPCIAEMPSMQKLYDDYQNKIVFFCHHSSFEKANAFLIKES